MLDLSRRPRGSGTAFVESLTSVVRRLAEGDVRTPPALIDIYLAAWRPQGREPDLPTFIASSLTESVNGTSALTQAIVACLSEVMNVPDLAAGTFLAAAGELFVARDFRVRRAWCPRCVAEPFPFDRLLWTLREMRSCPEHQILLVSAPSCGHRHQPLHPGANVSHCSECTTPLADAEEVAAETTTLERALIDILAWLQTGGAITRAAIAGGVSALLRERDITGPMLSRAIGVSRMAVTALVTSGSAPSLTTFARVVAFGGWTLSDLLSRGNLALPSPVRTTPPAAARRDLAALERVLSSELLLPEDERRDLAAIGAEVGVGPRYARNRLPELTRPWTEQGLRRRGRRRRVA